LYCFLGDGNLHGDPPPADPPYNGNITGDSPNDPPSFVGGGNYHLAPGSICIDAGTSDYSAPETDYDEDTRDANPDIGYDEFVAIVCTSDGDCDGICDPGESDPSCSGSDNCPETPNGPALGTCVRIVGGNMVSSYQVGGDFITCDEDADCAATFGICQMEQGDYTGSGCGDVCECEGNFDADGDVDALDALAFKADYGRMDCEEGNPCNGDFYCDGEVDALDAIMFKIDYGRMDCPLCSFSCF